MKRTGRKGVQKFSCLSMKWDGNRASPVADPIKENQPRKGSNKLQVQVKRGEKRCPTSDLRA